MWDNEAFEDGQSAAARFAPYFSAQFTNRARPWVGAKFDGSLVMSEVLNFNLFSVTEDQVVAAICKLP